MKKLLYWFQRNKPRIVLILLLVVMALATANVLKNRTATFKWFSDNKDALGAFSSLATIAAILVGGVLSYYRFFKGRTFSLRAELSLHVTVLDTTEDFKIHDIRLELKNIGSMSIWDPKPRIVLRKLGPKSEDTVFIDTWHEGMDVNDGVKRVAVVDSGETVSFFTTQEVRNSVWAVNYFANTSCSSGDLWKCTVTIPNTSGANK
jgi:hypothetical protein